MLTAEMVGEDGAKDEASAPVDPQLEDAKQKVKEEYAEMGVRDLDRITLTRMALKKLGRIK